MEYLETILTALFAIGFYELIGWLRVRRQRWSCPECSFRVTTTDPALRERIAEDHLKGHPGSHWF